MKKILTSFLLLATLATVFVSCKPDDEELEKAPSLVGTWTGNMISLWGTSSSATLEFTATTLTITYADRSSVSYGYTVSDQKRQDGDRMFTTRDPLGASHFYNITDNGRVLNITNGNSSFLLKGTYTKQ